MSFEFIEVGMTVFLKIREEMLYKIWSEKQDFYPRTLLSKRLWSASTLTPQLECT